MRDIRDTGKGFGPVALETRRDWNLDMVTHGSVHLDKRSSAPESRVGRWAVALGALTLTSVVLILLSIAYNVVDLPDSFSDNWLFGVWGLTIWATGLASMVTGAVAIIRRHERSWMVVLISPRLTGEVYATRMPGHGTVMTTAPVFDPLSAYLWAWAACCRGKALSTTDRSFPASTRLLMTTRSSGFSLTSTQTTRLPPTTDVHSI